MKYLIHFAHAHLPFRLPELQSLLQLNGIDEATAYDRVAAEADIERPFLVLDLPSEEVAIRIANRGILIKAVYEVWADGPDYESCASTLRDSLRAAGLAPAAPQGAAPGGTEVAAAAAAGAAAADSTVTLSTDTTGDRRTERAAPAPPAPHNGELRGIGKFFGADHSWCVNVCGFGRKYSMSKQQQIRSRFAFLPFLGPVSLKKPSQRYWVMEEIGLSEEERTAELPKHVFFLRQLATSARDLVNQQTLKRRRYLGPTSMDNELSLLMANQGLARPGAAILDPFVGTGSLLVSCTNFGARCTGWDIDTRVLRGMVKGKLTQVNVWSNFDQYGLRRPDLVRCDVSMHRTHLRWPTSVKLVAPPAPIAAGAAGTAGAAMSAHSSPSAAVDEVGGASAPALISRECSLGVFDAIVCDPPYGIRAGARRAGSRKAEVKAIPHDKFDDHIPQTKPYAPEDVMADLLALAARSLCVGGRLVYLLPSTYDYTDDDLPTHPCLRVVGNSEQPLTLKYARRLITMEKTCEFVLADEPLYNEHAERDRAKGAASYSNMIKKIQLMNEADRTEAATHFAGPKQGKAAKRRKWREQGKHKQLPPPQPQRDGGGHQH